MKADLHIHTNYSDSSLGLAHTLMRAKQRGLDQVSITDHDRFDHWPLIEELAGDLDLSCVIGIEISACDPASGRKVHILGYDFDPKKTAIKQLCAPILERRDQRSRDQMARLEEFGISIERTKIQDLARFSKTIYKQHILQVLTEAGIADGVVGEFYQTHFKGGGICAGDIQYVSAFDAIEAIKADGGLAVLAHPGESQVFDLVPSLIEAGLDAIERNHPRHDEAMLRLVDSFDLITTGGSDYHANYGPFDGLGQFLSPHFISQGKFQEANPFLTQR